MKAPDIRILTGEEFASVGYHGALFEAQAFPADCQPNSEFVLEYGFPATGLRKAIQTNCPIVNLPIIAAGDDPCDYAWKLGYNVDGFLSNIIHEYEWDGILQVKYFQNGKLFRTIVKKGYFFDPRYIDLRYPDPFVTCMNNIDTQPPNPGVIGPKMVLPAGCIDFYYLYTDIDGMTAPCGFVINPTINFKKKWAEQNYEDDAVFIPVSVIPDSSVPAGVRGEIDQTMMKHLTPNAPTNFRVVNWHGTHLSFTWNGDSEWYDVDDGKTIRRMTSRLFDDFNAKGSSKTYKIRSGNVNVFTDWVTFIATKKQ